MASHHDINLAKVPVKNAPASSPRQVYNPSVPISVYRQVASELQVARSQLSSLKRQNQHLFEQNQHLKQEVERVIHSTHRLQEPSARPHSIHLTEFNKIDKQARVRSQKPPSYLLPNREGDRIKGTAVIGTRNPTRSSNFANLNGRKLLLVTIIIMLVAFSCGFITVSPILNNRR
jgi:hypothetical protein